MRRYLPYLIVAFVALATFGSGFALYRSKKIAAPTAGEGAATGAHVRGPKSAPVTIEEFGDFQCPPCGILAPVLEKEEKKYSERLRVVFHHFPLAMHAHAREAALAAEAADLQGRFWEMHDLLYREQAVWSKASDVPTLFDSYARVIGLDLDRFKKDLQNPKVAAQVDADQKLGASRGVTSTPTLFINNVALGKEAINPSGVQKAIETALNEKPKP
jgi:protein-disulfide isomerase